MNSIVKTAFLFDLDGVIVDSEREYTRIWNAIDEQFPTGEDNFATKIKGTTLDNILSLYYPDNKVREKVETLLYKKEQEMTYQYCDGAKQLLDTLRDKGVAMALVTSSNDIKMRHLFRDRPELRDYFVEIIDDRKVTRSKPDPQGYLLGSAAVGADIKNCAVVEDSLQGVKAGKSAGAYVIGIAGTLPADVLSPYCDIVVERISEIDVDSTLRILSAR